MKFTKVCRKCKNEKSLDCFYKHANNRDLLKHECKDCLNKSSLKYYFNNKENLVEKRKDYHFQSNYGLSKEQVDNMKEAQENICPICLTVSKYVVDHDHKTGNVRGLICNSCNLAVAYLENNPGWADKAIAYLEKHGTPNENKQRKKAVEWSAIPPF